MSAEPDNLQSCEQCGATIYPEHLDAHSAERYQGRLLCAHCLKDAKSPASDDEDILSAELDDGPAAAGERSSRIQYVQGAMSASHSDSQYKRPLLKDSPFATRSRTFHCKLTDASFGHLNDQINEWADASDDVQIKFATSSVGTIEGKHSDPHLIITVFY